MDFHGQHVILDFLMEVDGYYSEAELIELVGKVNNHIFASTIQITSEARLRLAIESFRDDIRFFF